MTAPEPRVAQLVLCSPEGVVRGALPPIRVAQPWWQEVAGLVEQVRSDHGRTVTILRLLSAERAEPPGGAVTYLAEVAAGDDSQLPIEPWSGRLDSQQLRLPFAQPGGPARDLRWADARLQSLGIPRTGAAQQIRTWNLSSLWRLPVAGGAVWLKSVPPFFAHEGPVIELLRGFPVPRLLAHEAGRILMAEIPGTDLYGASREQLLAMVTTLVELQTAWTARLGELRRIGLPDWRVGPLTAAIADVVRRNATVLADDDRRTLDHFVDRLPSRFEGVTQCGIPDSLVHGDFAPGNTRGRGSSFVLLDWGDSGIGHPLLDQSAFLDRIDPAVGTEVRSHWAACWQQQVPGADAGRAATLLMPVAAARMAVIYQRFLDNIEPSEHPYHRADPPRWLLRVAALCRAEPS